MSGHPVIRGHFLKTVSYLRHVKEPVTKGHLSCTEILSDIEMSLEDRFYCNMSESEYFRSTWGDHIGSNLKVTSYNDIGIYLLVRRGLNSI